MGRELDSTSDKPKGGTENHPESALAETPQSERKSLNRQFPSREQVRAAANHILTNHLEPAYKTLSDIREMPPIPTGVFAEYLRGFPLKSDLERRDYMYNPDLRGHVKSDGTHSGPYIQQHGLDGLLTSNHFADLRTINFPNAEVLATSKHVKNVREAVRLIEGSHQC